MPYQFLQMVDKTVSPFIIKGMVTSLIMGLQNISSHIHMQLKNPETFYDPSNQKEGFLCNTF